MIKKYTKSKIGLYYLKNLHEKLKADGKEVIGVYEERDLLEIEFDETIVTEADIDAIFSYIDNL